MEIDIPVWRQELTQKGSPGVLGPCHPCLGHGSQTAQTKIYGEPWGNNETPLTELGIPPDAVLVLRERNLRDDAGIERVVNPPEPENSGYDGEMSVNLCFSDPDNVLKLEGRRVEVAISIQRRFNPN